jgi:hypothetical protein
MDSDKRSKIEVNLAENEPTSVSGEWADYLSQANPLIRGSLSKASFANAIESLGDSHTARAPLASK